MPSQDRKQDRQDGKTQVNQDAALQAVPEPDTPETAANPGKPQPRAQAPDWAKDLRSLYDSVVQEPLPDTFLDLLAKLDQEPE